MNFKLRHSVILLITIQFALLLGGCKKEKELSTTNNGIHIENPVDKKTALQIVNSLRTKGYEFNTNTTFPPTAPLKWSDLLASIAEKHAQDMEDNDYFNHISLDGTNPGDRMTAGGYIWASYAENIAFGYTSETTVIQGWIDSKGHCTNIMNTSVKEMGIGKSKSGKYWVQLFGRNARE